MSTRHPAYGTRGLGRIVEGEADYQLRPRTPTGVGVVFFPGAGHNVTLYTSKALGGHPVMAALARRLRWTAWAGDMGGLYTFGNDDVLEAAEAAHALLVADGCSPRIVVAGVSEGWADACRFAAEHPDLVRGGIGIMPVADVEAVRARNWAGLKAHIETALGIGPADPIPDTYLPLERGADLAGFRALMLHSTADTVTLPAEIEALADVIGPTAQTQVISSELEHSTELLEAVPLDDVVTWAAGLD